MQIHFRNLLVAATIILLASCSKSNTQGKLIPKEASFVVQVNGKALSSKLSWEEIKQNPLFKDATADSSIPADMKVLLSNPDSAGIDAAADLMVFVLKDSVGGYIGFEGSIKNEATFKAFNKLITENGVESEKEGINYMSKYPFCVGYSKDKFVYIFDAPQMAGMDALSRRMQQDSIAVPAPKTRDIGATCKAIFALSESNSLADNKKFSKLMGESGDLHFWMNSEELMKSTTMNPMMAMVKLDDFYKGSVTTASLTFDNGKISIEAKSYVGGELAKIYKKYSGGKVSDEMMKRMPGKDVVGLMAFTFKPEGIREILKMTGTDGFANMGLSQVGFTMDDFIKANKGDVLFGVSDLSVKTDSVKLGGTDLEENSYPIEKPVFTYVFATSIGDKDAFNKLINAGKKLGSSMGDSANAPFAYSSDGKYFALANNKENAAKYIAGENTNFDFISKINGQAFGGYVNIQLLLKSFGTQAAKDSSAKVVYDASLKLWDNILMKGGDMNGDDAITQTVEINLMDKTTNSLKQLNQYASKLSEVYKAKRDKEKADMMAYQDLVEPKDSTVQAISK